MREKLKTLLPASEAAWGDTGYWSLEHGVSKNELIAAIVTHMERSQDDLG
jgi:hypothetical protein